VDSETAEIDFSVAPALRGKGLGTKALALTWRSAGQALKVKRLRGVVIDSNPPSARAFLKAGFRQVVQGELVHGRACSIFERNLGEPYESP
jgi:RimJ/RimL family protein N-acetyltransferase